MTETEQEVIRENKKLIERYPFLRPRNRWTDEADEDYDYTWTELDDFPEGWRKAFGEEMLEDLREDLIRVNYLDEFRIMEIKEKYGTLRFYIGGVPAGSHANDIIDKYEHISSHTCICCGKVDVPVLDDGWVSPYCKKCYRNMWEKRESYWENPREYSEEMYDKYIVDDNPLSPTYGVMSWSKEEGEKTRKVDVSDILNRMKKRNPKLFEKE